MGVGCLVVGVALLWDDASGPSLVVGLMLLSGVPLMLWLARWSSGYGKKGRSA